MEQGLKIYCQIPAFENQLEKTPSDESFESSHPSPVKRSTSKPINYTSLLSLSHDATHLMCATTRKFYCLKVDPTKQEFELIGWGSGCSESKLVYYFKNDSNLILMYIKEKKSLVLFAYLFIFHQKEVKDPCRFMLQLDILLDIYVFMNLYDMHSLYINLNVMNRMDHWHSLKNGIQRPLFPLKSNT